MQLHLALYIFLLLWPYRATFYQWNEPLHKELTNEIIDSWVAWERAGWRHMMMTWLAKSFSVSKGGVNLKNNDVQVCFSLSFSPFKWLLLHSSGCTVTNDREAAGLRPVLDGGGVGDGRRCWCQCSVLDVCAWPALPEIGHCNEQEVRTVSELPRFCRSKVDETIHTQQRRCISFTMTLKLSQSNSYRLYKRCFLIEFLKLKK